MLVDVETRLRLVQPDRLGLCRELITWLSKQGVPIWSDAGIVYGSRWPAEVRDAVDGSGAVVVVMSPAAESSEWVDRELARAELKGLPVLPLLLAGDPFFRLGSTQYEDVRGGRMPGEAFVRRVLGICQTSGAAAHPDRSGEPILIHDGSRSVYERVEPLAAYLAALLRSLITRSEDAFLILERPDDPDHYAQVGVEEESDFQVEYRDGGPDRHYAAITDDADLAARARRLGRSHRRLGQSAPVGAAPVLLGVPPARPAASPRSHSVSGCEPRSFETVRPTIRTPRPTAASSPRGAPVTGESAGNHGQGARRGQAAPTAEADVVGPWLHRRDDRETEPERAVGAGGDGDGR